MTQTITGDQLLAVTFAAAKGFARPGYEPRDVDTFLRRAAAAVDALNDRLVAAEHHLQDAAREVRRLRDRIDRDSRTEHVQQAITVLTTAQITADSTVAQADEYSRRVMNQARDLYEDTRRAAATLEQETAEKARLVCQDAARRAADLERDHQDRLAHRTLTVTTAQQELDEQSRSLRALRRATGLQAKVFLEGLLDHLAEEYGRAHPIAAQAATETPTHTTVRPGRQPAPPPPGASSNRTADAPRSRAAPPPTTRHAPTRQRRPPTSPSPTLTRPPPSSPGRTAHRAATAAGPPITVLAGSHRPDRAVAPHQPASERR